MPAGGRHRGGGPTDAQMGCRGYEGGLQCNPSAHRRPPTPSDRAHGFVPGGMWGGLNETNPARQPPPAPCPTRLAPPCWAEPAVLPHPPPALSSLALRAWTEAQKRHREVTSSPP